LGHKNVVSFRDFCNHLVSDAWYRSDDDEDTVAVKKVKEAATLIRVQIREMEYSNGEYSNSSDLYLEKCKADVPSLLHVFINSLVPNTGADPENELGGGQCSPPAGSRGGAPVGGLGDEVPQKLTTFRS